MKTNAKPKCIHDVIHILENPVELSDNAVGTVETLRECILEIAKQVRDGRAM